MIGDLDDTLTKLIQDSAKPSSVLKLENRIFFLPPDADWRAAARPLSLNIYLCRVQEPSDGRETGWTTVSNPGQPHTRARPAPRIECCYVITAWSLAGAPDDRARTREEHALLGEVLTILLQHPVIPREMLQGELAAQLDEPALLAVGPDDFGADRDFWTSFGTYSRPSLTCRVVVAWEAPVGSADTVVTKPAILNVWANLPISIEQ